MSRPGAARGRGGVRYDREPGAAPASWWVLAWRAGVGAQRYDAASGIELTEPTGRPPREQFIVWSDDPRIGMAGFGAGRSTRASGRAWSGGAGELRAADAALGGAAGAREAGGGGGVGVAGRRDRGRAGACCRGGLPGWHSYDFEVPAEALGPGFNYAAVAQLGAIAATCSCGAGAGRPTRGRSNASAPELT